MKNIYQVKSAAAYRRIWVSYFFVKVFYLFFAKLVFAKLTTLGDTFRYLNGPTAFQSNWLLSSTAMMDTVASSFAVVLGKFLGSFPFLIISFFGVYYPISKLNISKKNLLILIAFLSLPSFGVWTSIASKEAVGVFYMGVILAAYMDLWNRERISNKILLVFAVYLCFIFKPQYMIGISALFLYTYIGRRFSVGAAEKLVVFILSVLIAVLVLYYFRDEIDRLSKIMPLHFSERGGATRENTIWVEQYDFFKNAWYGMYIGFVGPTLDEAFSKATHLMAWLESMTILTGFFWCMYKYFYVSLRVSRFNLMFLCGFALASFWILFVHYPFSAINPGSAIRYRESFYAFLVILFYFMYSNAISPYVCQSKSRNYNPGGSH
ncbi:MULTISPECIES: hypothetical protein [unclassified Marinobacter]|uniref:hypothetical protein n=1 Tax=unclassified Marinobacter TaxID=83889 RepID=UPI0018F11765|nr:MULTISPECIES: hypothetical protein [unclassified Marinobacter]